MPRRTKRQYWLVSCLPSTSDKPIVRVNASWMELFTIYAVGEGKREADQVRGVNIMRARD